MQILCRASEELRRERIERRAREALRHPGQLDASTPYSSAAATFLEIPSIRLEFGGSESSKATEQLIAALDVSMQQPP